MTKRFRFFKFSVIWRCVVVKILKNCPSFKDSRCFLKFLDYTLMQVKIWRTLWERPTCCCFLPGIGISRAGVLQYLKWNYFWQLFFLEVVNFCCKVVHLRQCRALRISPLYWKVIFQVIPDVNPGALLHLRWSSLWQ